MNNPISLGMLCFYLYQLFGPCQVCQHGLRTAVRSEGGRKYLLYKENCFLFLVKEHCTITFSLAQRFLQTRRKLLKWTSEMCVYVFMNEYI